MRRLATLVLAAASAATALPAAAQFALTEVSGLGAPPFLLADGGATFEDLAPGVVYNIYRRLPGDDFQCLAPDLPSPTWAGDPATPTAAVWWYVVNAWDGTDENRHGSSIPIAAACHAATPIPATKSATPPAVPPGGGSEFRLVVDNSAGTSDLVNCSFRDEVALTGCMTLAGCVANPAIAGLSCDLPTSVASASGFSVPAGQIQEILLTVVAGAVETTCGNSFTVTCGARSGAASGSLDIRSLPQATVTVRKTASPGLVRPGANATFLIEIENTGTVDATNLSLTDLVDATGCMTLASCDASNPPLGAALVCNPPSGLTATGFNLRAGQTQTITITVTAGATETPSCINAVSVQGDNLAPTGGAGGLSIASSCTPPSTGCTPVAGRPPLRTTLVVSGLASPVHLTAVPGDTTRLFVVEQAGRIRIVRGGMVEPTPFLDIVGQVRSGGERGLLSLAFHPAYASNGLFYVYFTRQPDGSIVVAEFRVTANPDVADPTSARVVWTCDHTFAGNHNGGQVAFSPCDGFLYIGTGDGGGGGDPLESGENLGACLGKIHRIDVDSRTSGAYGVPTSNPFVGVGGALPEIWAYGVRNPWRFSFDRATGDLYIGEVGQNQWEEIDVQPGSSRGGEHYGWNMYEGDRHCFDPPCDPVGKTWPVLEYDHGVGSSVTGGHVYRGCLLPGYHGTYFYADYSTYHVWSFEYDAGSGTATNRQEWTSSFTGPSGVSSFGEDAAGEIYIVALPGRIYRITN